MDGSDTSHSPLPIDRESLADALPTQTPTTPQAHDRISMANAVSDYANFCRLSGLPEELLFDFGVNVQVADVQPQVVRVTQRVVTGWQTAKRLIHVLEMSLARHEAAFGALETDVQKRLQRAVRSNT